MTNVDKFNLGLFDNITPEQIRSLRLRLFNELRPGFVRKNVIEIDGCWFDAYIGVDVQLDLFFGFENPEHGYKFEVGVVTRDLNHAASSILAKHKIIADRANTIFFDIVTETIGGKRLDALTGRSALTWGYAIASSLLGFIGRGDSVDFILLGWEEGGDNYVQYRKAIENNPFEYTSAITSTWSYKAISKLLGFGRIIGGADLKSNKDIDLLHGYHFLLAPGEFTGGRIPMIIDPYGIKPKTKWVG